MVENSISHNIVNIGSLTMLQVVEWLLGVDIYTLANSFVRLDI